MVRVAVELSSGFRSHAQRLAKEVAAGVRKADDVEVRLIPVSEVDDHWESLPSAHAITFGSPTYRGSISARSEEFIERLVGDIWLQRAWASKLTGGSTVSAGRNGDKWSSLMQLFVGATQMGMIRVPVPLLGGNYSTAGSEDDLSRMAGDIGSMAKANIDQGPEHAPPDSDLRAALIYGAHIALLAKQFLAGRRAVGVADVEPFRGRPRVLHDMLPPP